MVQWIETVKYGEVKMDATMKTFLDILKAALAGQKAELNRQLQPDEWETLFSMTGITMLRTR